MAQREILNLSINENGDLFAASMETGIKIYNMEPLAGKLFLDSNIVGSVGIAKVLHRTNLIAIVGGGYRPKFAKNAVLIWDDYQKKFIMEFTFPNPVLALNMCKDRLFVVERFRIHCFSFPHSPRKIFTIDTRDNPNGICETTPLTSATELQLIAFPGYRIGTVQLIDLSHTKELIQKNLNDLNNNESNQASTSISPCIIAAHTSDIAAIALNRTGSLLATASRKGTLIRIFRTVDLDHTNPYSRSNAPLLPTQIVEFRRGIDQAMVYGIAFSPNSDYVLVSSDKGTVHIFALKDTRLNRRSTLSMPLVNSACYALAKYTFTAECACVCTFGSDPRTVYSICVDGTFHKWTFKIDGTCTRENFDNFLNVPDEADHILL